MILLRNKGKKSVLNIQIYGSSKNREERKNPFVEMHCGMGGVCFYIKKG
jgi:hypothetical protein